MVIIFNHFLYHTHDSSDINTETGTAPVAERFFVMMLPSVVAVIEGMIRIRDVNGTLRMEGWASVSR